MTFSGDIKDLSVLLEAAKFFHKSLAGFSEVLLRYTINERKKYCDLMVTTYRQILSKE